MNRSYRVSKRKRLSRHDDALDYSLRCYQLVKRYCNDHDPYLLIKAFNVIVDAKATKKALDAVIAKHNLPSDLVEKMERTFGQRHRRTLTVKSFLAK